MTSKQWTAIGSIATLVTVGLMLFQKTGTTEVTVNGGRVGTVNANATIGTQTNVYQDTPNPSFENPRPSSLSDLHGQELIETWFNLMNRKLWKEGCSLLSKDKCNSENGDDVLNNSREPRLKLVNGYENAIVWHADSSPDDTWCVKYSTHERQSTVSREIIYVMQYKLSPRTDGGEDIASRLCEKKWASGLGERSCGEAGTQIHYCL